MKYYIYLFVAIATVIIQLLIMLISKDSITKMSIPLIAGTLTLYTRIRLNMAVDYDAAYYSFVHKIFVLVFIASILITAVCIVLIKVKNKRTTL